MRMRVTFAVVVSKRRMCISLKNPEMDVCLCVRVRVCMWVQGWTTHSKHIKALPFALRLLNSELEPTQSVLSLVSLCLLLLSMQPQSIL